MKLKHGRGLGFWLLVTLLEASKEASYGPGKLSEGGKDMVEEGAGKKSSETAPLEAT